MNFSGWVDKGGCVLTLHLDDFVVVDVHGGKALQMYFRLAVEVDVELVRAQNGLGVF